MPATAETFAETMKTLGDPDALRAADSAPGVRPLVNAHVHLPPNFTAFETTAQALELADAQGVGVLGASNYYDYDVYGEFADEARRRGVFPLFGLEIISLVEPLVGAGVLVNDPGNPGKMYVCGKGITRFDPLSDEAARLLGTIRDSDARRMAAVTETLAGVFAGAGLDTGLDAEAIKDRVAARHGCPRGRVYLQERHVAQAFQEVVFERLPEGGRDGFLARVYGAAPKAPSNDVAGVQNDIRSFLMKAGKPAFVPDTFVDFGHAYQLILALGGVPCYPTLADGATPICGYEADVDALIADLKARNIPAAELIPIRNTPDVLARYAKTMRAAGLFVTAGTEHNTRDLLPLAPTCVNGAPIPDDVQAIFWEGACVVAAHQYLTSQGLPGFVDGAGRPNPDFPSADARIAAFAELGASVIARYRAACAS